MVKQIDFKKQERITTGIIILLILNLNVGCVDKKVNRSYLPRNRFVVTFGEKNLEFFLEEPFLPNYILTILLTP